MVWTIARNEPVYHTGTFFVLEFHTGTYSVFIYVLSIFLTLYSCLACMKCSGTSRFTFRALVLAKGSLPEIRHRPVFSTVLFYMPELKFSNFKFISS
jgi:hypothetical protein